MTVYARCKALFARLDARALVMLLPAAVSLMWYLVMANHSFDHTFYTYRNLACGVLAGYALLVSLAGDARGDTP